MKIIPASEVEKLRVVVFRDDVVPGQWLQKKLDALLASAVELPEPVDRDHYVHSLRYLVEAREFRKALTGLLRERFGAGDDGNEDYRDEVNGIVALFLLTRPIPDDKLREAYNELLYSVETKYEGETRHATALRYIKEAETQKVSGLARAALRETEDLEGTP